MVFPDKYKENMSSLYFLSILEFLMQIKYPDSGIYEVIIVTLGSNMHACFQSYEDNWKETLCKFSHLA